MMIDSLVNLPPRSTSLPTPGIELRVGQSLKTLQQPIPRKNSRRDSEMVLSDGPITPPTSPGPADAHDRDAEMSDEREHSHDRATQDISVFPSHLLPMDAAMRSVGESDEPRGAEGQAGSLNELHHRSLSDQHRDVGDAASLRLTDFDVKGTLGTGTFAKVLLVRLRTAPNQSEAMKYFAMKVLRKSEIVRLRQVEHVNAERHILSRIRHPFIVDLYATFQDNLNIYMLLSYVPGGELFTHLRRARRFTPDVTRFYLATIILALKYLHSFNIIYRDLKPENLLLDSRGYLRLTDFGFAKIVEDRTWTLCGTPEYLAPEIIQSDGHGKAADWWACGILCYEMLVGYPPFFDETAYGIYEKILRGKIHWPREMDPLSRELIRAFLHPDRSKRLGNMIGGPQDILEHPWFRGVDWEALERREIRAPIIPHVSSPDDTRHFSNLPCPAEVDIPGLIQGNGQPLTPLQRNDYIAYQFAQF